MMPRAFKLEVISKQIYFRGVRKTWETWNEKKKSKSNGKLKVCFSPSESGTKPPAESQLT